MRRAFCLAVLAAGMVGWAPRVRAQDDTTFKVFWKEGLRFETTDKQFRLQIGGRIHNDWVWWAGEDDVQTDLGEEINDDTAFRRARLFIAGDVYEHVIFKAEYDFAEGETTFKDVYVGLTDVPVIGTAIAGHFKEPFSLEEMMSSNHMTFIERAPMNVLVASRNNGIGIHRTFAEERSTLAFGAYRESDDIGDSQGDNMQFSGRLTGLPLYQEEGERLVHLGFSYRRQNPDDDNLSVSARPEVRLAPRFIDTGDLAVDDVNKYGVEAGAVFGPLYLQGEYVWADVSSAEPDVDQLASDDPLLTGGYAFASWMITGEHRRYDTGEGEFAGIKPHRNFMQGGPGAWEVALRWSTTDLDDSGAQGGELDDITAGVNWYLNPNARVMFNYVHVDLDGSDPAHAFLTRFMFFL